MMRNLIGSKESFGIEYEIQPGEHDVFGNMRLWIEGKYIGTFEDENILSVALGHFDLTSLDKFDGCQFSNKKPGEIYELIESYAVPGSGYCHFMPGEAFDDFIIYRYACNGNLHFVWRLCDRPFFKHPGYPKGIQSAVVSIDEFRTVVAEYKKIIASEESSRNRGAGKNRS